MPLKHSRKYKKLIADIRKHGTLCAKGHCFTLHGYVRNGIDLSPKQCHIVFQKVSKHEPHGILYSPDRTRVTVIHDFNDINSIFNLHRTNHDGEGCVVEEEFLCDTYRKGEHWDSDLEKEESPTPQTSDYSKPVFVSSWAVFEQYLTDGVGVFVDRWFPPSNE